MGMGAWFAAACVLAAASLCGCAPDGESARAARSPDKATAAPAPAPALAPVTTATVEAEGIDVDGDGVQDRWVLYRNGQARAVVARPIDGRPGVRAARFEKLTPAPAELGEGNE